MKLCIPVRIPNGLDSCIEPHLPHAEHLLFFDTETRQCEHVSLRDDEEGTRAGMPFDAVLCGSFDGATRQALVDRGVMVVGTEARTAGEAIAEFEAANLALGNITAEHAGGGCCQERGQHADHDETHHHAGEGCCQNGGSAHAGKEHHGCNGKGGCGGRGHGQGDDHEHKEGGCGCGGQDRHQDAFARKMRADALRIAVSSQNRKTVTDHAGRCRKFWVYEVRQNKVDNKVLRELTLEQTLHSSQLGEDHPLDDVHVLITAGMSPFLYQRLQRSGIRGFVTDQSDPDLAVQTLLQKVAQG